MPAEGKERFGTGRAPGGMGNVDFCSLLLRPAGGRQGLALAGGYRSVGEEKNVTKTQRELMTFVRVYVCLEPASLLPEQAEPRANPIRIRHVRSQSSPTIPARIKNTFIGFSL